MRERIAAAALLVSLASCAGTPDYEYVSVHVSVVGSFTEGATPEETTVSLYADVLRVNAFDAQAIPAVVEIGPAGGPLTQLVEDEVDPAQRGTLIGWAPEYEIHVVIESEGVDFRHTMSAPEPFGVTLSPDRPVVDSPLTVSWSPTLAEGEDFVVSIATPFQGSDSITFHQIADGAAGAIEVPGTSFPRPASYHFESGSANRFEDRDLMGVRFDAVIGLGLSVDRVACSGAGGACTIPDDCCSATCGLDLTCQ